MPATTLLALVLAAATAAPPALPEDAIQAPPLTVQPGTTLQPNDLEAELYGRRLAAGGTLAALLPLQVRAETEALVAAHPELSPADRAALRAVAASTAEAGTARLMLALAHAYAQRLTKEQLQALVAFEETAPARALRAAQPYAIAATMQAVGTMDFKADTLAAFCKQTGKLCDK